MTADDHPTDGEANPQGYHEEDIGDDTTTSTITKQSVVFFGALSLSTF
jgi:hypothetical protein